MTELTMSNAGWAQKERGIDAELRKVAEPAFRLPVQPTLRVLAGVRLVFEYLEQWREELVRIAERQVDREYRMQQMTTLATLAGASSSGSRRADRTTGAAGGSAAAGGGASRAAVSGRAAQSSTVPRTDLAAKIAQADIKHEDGCRFWSGKPGSCAAPRCRFDHPPGRPSEANNKWRRKFEEEPPQPRRQ